MLAKIENRSGIDVAVFYGGGSRPATTFESEIWAALTDKERKYNELIMGVSKKFPDETRHQTALRYIIERDQGSNDCGAKTDRAAVEKGEGE